MAISRPDPRRRPKLPRNLPGRRRLQPYSQADAPYFRSPGFYVRIGGLAVVVAAGLALLLLRAWSIQVLHGKQYSKEASQQAYRTVDLTGARGAIVDDRGRLIAGTTGNIVVDADAASLGSRNQHGVWTPSAEGLRAIGRLAHFAGLRKGPLVRRIAHDVLQSPFAPAVVISHPRAALANYIQERAGAFPGFKVEPEFSRSYPLGAFGSEFLGLLGQVSQTELKSGAYKNVQAGEIVGQSGVEAAYDSILNAGFVKAKIPVNSLGLIAGPLVVPKEKQPPTLQLSIDENLERATEKAVVDGMADARAAGYSPTGGSAIAIDPYTGAIKAIASYPTFSEKLAATNSNYLAELYRNTVTTPTLDRAIAGSYPTGSTFKPIIAEAALSAGIITPYTPQLCSGSFTLGNTIFHNVEAGIYESMTLPTALAQSCDTWFYRLGDRIWQADPAAEGSLIQRWASMLGLGEQPRIDLTGATSGYLPTPGSYFTKRFGFPWTEGQTINLAIGQGALQVSPLQLAVAYSALINGGTVVQPHVAEAVIRNGVTHELRFKPVRKVKLSPYTSAIEQGLYEAANTSQGTSFAIFNGFKPTVAGKTGTAQAAVPGHADDDSWYASWAPYGHPKLVVVVQIEHGGFGANAAAPAAKEIYQAYFHQK
ncbi:MAG TPA: penicillin-binding transpeptidase domain-containing protein [Gaiellaceae bacterium]|nr:penicillin-binding transpeptidase domain-containing protein [Gaiellaceae bacterium]